MCGFCPLVLSEFRDDKVMIWSRSQIFEIFGRLEGEFSKEDSPLGFNA
jgi:hypothetical protein